MLGTPAASWIPQAVLFPTSLWITGLKITKKSMYLAFAFRFLKQTSNPSIILLRRERVTASGGEVGRLSIVGGVEIGPLRCWPGGLCLSRSIGDMDVGEFIVPVPFVKQVKVHIDLFCHFTNKHSQLFIYMNIKAIKPWRKAYNSL